MIILFRFKTRNVLIDLLFILTALVSGCGDSSDHPTEGGDSTVLVTGAPMIGGANGLFFDRDNMLYVANVFGQTISRIDPESGEVVERLGRDQGIDASADDLVIDAFGTLYWTDVIRGMVKGRTSGEEVFTVAQGFPSANPITLGDDGRLFFAQCFAGGSNGIYEGDPAGVMEPRTIRDGDIDCASNGMDWWDDVLYAPRWFEGRVVAVDIDSGELRDITTGWGAPAAVKFNSQGELHAVNQGNGEVVRIDISTGERHVLAVFPEGWLDNLAFDVSDRLYVSSASDGAVVEILDDGKTREVSPGGMVVPMGLALIGNTLYTSEIATLRGFDSRNGEEVYTLRTTFGLGPFDNPTNIAAMGDKLILMSFMSNQLLIWDLARNSAVTETSFLLPVDAVPFQGDILVTEIGAGRVTRVRMPDLVEREVIVDGLFFPSGLAVHESDVYVSDSVQGTVFQIVREGEVLADPEPVATDLAVPEGIEISPDGAKLLVVEGDIGNLTQIDLQSGERLTIASGLEFQPRKAIPGLITHWFNNVVVDNSGVMYVNGDGASIIYKFRPDN